VEGKKKMVHEHCSHGHGGHSHAPEKANWSTRAGALKEFFNAGVSTTIWVAPLFDYISKTTTNTLYASKAAYTYVSPVGIISALGSGFYHQKFYQRFQSFKKLKEEMAEKEKLENHEEKPDHAADVPRLTWAEVFLLAADTFTHTGETASNVMLLAYAIAYIFSLDNPDDLQVGLQVLATCIGAAFAYPDVVACKNMLLEGKKLEALHKKIDLSPLEKGVPTENSISEGAKPKSSYFGSWCNCFKRFTGSQQERSGLLPAASTTSVVIYTI
jgi:hypothetical protein